MTTEVMRIPQKSYDSKEGITSALRSWKHFFALIEMRRDAAQRGESLSWFLVRGMFELAPNGWCFEWRQGAFVSDSAVLDRSDFQLKGGGSVLLEECRASILVPPLVLKCSVCGHVFRINDVERREKSSNNISLERFEGVSFRRMFSRMNNMTSNVYAIPVVTTVRDFDNRMTETLDFQQEKDLDRIIGQGYFLEIVFLKFSHVACGVNRFEAREACSDRVQKDSPSRRGRNNVTVQKRGRSNRIEGVERVGARPRIHREKNETSRAKVSRKRGDSSRTPKQSVRHWAPRARALDGMSRYREVIRQYSLLTAEEEKELIPEIRKGNRTAFERFYCANLRLAAEIARTFWLVRPKRVCLGMDDMIQEANTLLLRAVAGFDPDEGTRFSTFAVPVIENGLNRVYQESGDLAISVGTVSKHVRFARSLERFLEVFEYGEAIARAASETGISLASARKYAQMYSEGTLVLSRGFISGDAPLKEGGGDSLFDITPSGIASPEEKCIELNLRKTIEGFLCSIPYRTVRVLQDRFGLSGEEKTLEEVGAELGLTRERIRQIEQKGLQKINRNLCEQGMCSDDFL